MQMTLICYDEDDKEYRFPCENGFVSRVVSEVFNSGEMGCHSDARRVLEILNADARKREAA